MANVLGKKSKKVYDTLHEDLQIILSWGLKICVVDFSLYEGHRPPERQFEYYKKGRELIEGKWRVIEPKKKVTNIDGYIIKGKHNFNPSLAVDLHAHVPDKPQLTWDIRHLSYIAGSLISIADWLFDEGLIQHKLRWGGNWDKDGDLMDNSLYDLPHFELYKP